MSAGRIDKDLEDRLEAIRQKHGESVPFDQIGEVVRSMLDTMTGDVNAADLKLYRELEGLSGYIHAARAEIASLRPQDIQKEYIASATDELDAIVEATETATNDIMDAVEGIEDVQGRLEGKLADDLMAATTLIYEACTFQDITGQRITKVVKALKHIEEKIEALVQAFGATMPEAEKQAPAATAVMTDEDLLNGPALPGGATDQAEIDRLFADFN